MSRRPIALPSPIRSPVCGAAVLGVALAACSSPQEVAVAVVFPDVSTARQAAEVEVTALSIGKGAADSPCVPLVAGTLALADVDLSKDASDRITLDTEATPVQAVTFPLELSLGTKAIYAEASRADGTAFVRGCTTTAARAGSGISVSLTARTPDAPSVTFTTTSESIDPRTRTFRADPDGLVTAYSWNFGDGATAAGPSTQHTFLEDGTFRVSLEVTGPGGGARFEEDIIIDSSSPAPVANFFATPTSGPAPLAVQFTHTASGVIETYAWDFGDGELSSEENLGHLFLAPGKYTVSLTVTGPGGSDTRTETELITVTP